MKVKRSDEVLFEVIDGTAVLVDPDGRELFTLNRVGSDPAARARSGDGRHPHRSDDTRVRV